MIRKAIRRITPHPQPIQPWPKPKRFCNQSNTLSSKKSFSNPTRQPLRLSMWSFLSCWQVYDLTSGVKILSLLIRIFFLEVSNNVWSKDINENYILLFGSWIETQNLKIWVKITQEKHFGGAWTQNYFFLKILFGAQQLHPIRSKVPGTRMARANLSGIASHTLLEKPWTTTPGM